MDTIIKFWTDLGWLANFLGIAVPVIAVLGVIYKSYNYINNKLKKNSESNYSDIKSYITKTKSTLQKKPSVAIVDDQVDELFPVADLTRAGYNITPIKSISLSSFEFLFSYDIIILDVTDVVLEDMERGGLTLMKKIKEKSPRQIVVACSSKKFDPTLTEFFKLGDKQISTPITYSNLENLLERLAEEKLNPLKVAEQIDYLIGGKSIDHKNRIKLIRSCIEFLNGASDSEKFMLKNSNVSHLIQLHELIKLLERLKELM